MSRTSPPADRSPPGQLLLATLRVLSPAYSTPPITQFPDADTMKLSDLGASNLPESLPTLLASEAPIFHRYLALLSVLITQDSTSYHRQAVFPNTPSSHRLLRRELERSTSERSVQSYERAKDWSAAAVE